MYKLKKVVLNQNGMNRVGFFVYSRNKISPDPTDGFVGGFVVKNRQNENEYTVFKSDDAFNYGRKIQTYKTVTQANEHAEHCAQEFLISLYKKQREMIIHDKKKDLASVAVA